MERKEELLADIERELRRINCPEFIYHPEHERMSLETHSDASVTRTSWPQPRQDNEALVRLLERIPTNATVEQVNEITRIYSMGWDSGRNGLLIQQQEARRPELAEMPHNLPAPSSPENEI